MRILIATAARLETAALLPQIMQVTGRLELGGEILLEGGHRLEGIRSFLEPLDLVDGGGQHSIFVEVDESFSR